MYSMKILRSLKFLVPISSRLNVNNQYFDLQGLSMLGWLFVQFTKVFNSLILNFQWIKPIGVFWNLRSI